MTARPTSISEMRALSVRQPWAWAILHAGKDVENRSRRTSIRGPILIHAGKTIDHDALVTFRSMGIEVPMGLIETGGIIGAIEIVDVVQKSESRWFFGPQGYVLRNPVSFEMIPCRGQQGFFMPDMTAARPRERHVCSVCGGDGEWLPGWLWHGSQAQIDAGEEVEKTCSDVCRQMAEKRR